MPADSQPVIFSSADYATMWRRAASCIIDLLVIVLIFAGVQLWYAYKYVPPEIRAMPDTPARQKLLDQHLKPVMGQISILGLGIIAIYIIPVRQLRGGGIGYRLMGIRMVDAAGNPPALGTLLKRAVIIAMLMFFALIPVVIVAAAGRGLGPSTKTLVMIAGVFLFIMMAYRRCLAHARRQAVHDRWCGTWMVRKNAWPVGPADLKYHTIFLGTWPIRHIELDPSLPPEGLGAAPEAAGLAAAGPMASPDSP